MQLSRLIRIPQTVRNIQRLRQILGVIVKYGFDDLVARMELDSLVEFGRRVVSRKGPDEGMRALRTEERIRLAFEELGPTFIKFGQILATRPDLVPMSLVQELRKLQDRVPPFGADEARKQIEEELGSAIEEVFTEFDETPLAAASIAQVHKAKLADGTVVAVKVRRPQLGQIIATDLDVLAGLAQLFEEKIPESRSFNPVAIVKEFRKSITREVDFRREALSIHKFARNFADDPAVAVPGVHDEHSTEKLLVMDHIDGIKVTDREALAEAGIDCGEIASKGVRFVLEQIFAHGFFHADPHPGNIFILPGNIICMIDYGMMGSVDPERIDDILALLMALLMKDVDRIVKLFFKLQLVDEDADLRELRADSLDLIDRYYEVPLESIDIGRFIGDIFEVGVRHRVRVPADLLLMGKALATIEGIARDLAPDLDPVNAVRPFIIRQYIARLTDPRHLTKDLLDTIEEYMLLARTLPRDIRQILAKVKREELALPIRPLGQDRELRNRNRTVNRAIVAGITGALSVGSSILIASDSGPLVLGLSFSTLLGFAGFAMATILGLILALSILRSDGI